MTASARILDHFSKANGSEPIRILGASGQLGYGVPAPAFSVGPERKPHLTGCDMGSIDIGPYYLGRRARDRAGCHSAGPAQGAARRAEAENSPHHRLRRI